MRSWRETWQLVRETAGRGYVLLGLALVLTAAWLRLVLPEWTSNPDLSHGIFTPLLFVLLIKESRNRGPWRWLPETAWTHGGLGLVTFGSLACMVVGALFASALDWSHPMVMFLLGSSFAGAVAAAVIYAAQASLRIVPFNYVAGIAGMLWFLSLPIPPGTYSDLTLTLQLWVSERVLGSLHLLGIPAVQTGNIIELANTSVGVEEACSGVRSLISCVYAGFFFSAAFVRRWFSRVFLIVLAPLLAIGMNFIRSLTLTLLANAGIDIEGTWHDATGFAILGITAIILAALAIGLEKVEGSRVAGEPTATSAATATRPRRRGGRILTAGYASAVACLVLFFALTRPTVVPSGEIPRILSFLPAAPEGWGTATSRGLYRFAEILETDHLGQRTYVKESADGERTQITFYLAYWPPGQAGVSVVATHTPDACWPGAGWTPLPTEVTEVELDLPQGTLGRAEYRRFTNAQVQQHVWFWHSYDRELIKEFDPRRPVELLKSVFTYGVRSEGEQLFVRMSSNRSWEDIKDEPLVAEIFRGLKPFGL